MSTMGYDEATIKKYIQEQEKNDILQNKLSVKEYEDNQIRSEPPVENRAG